MAALAFAAGPVGAITESLFSDNFNTADSADPSLNLATRQTGTLATRTYTNVRGGGSIAGSQLMTITSNSTETTTTLSDSPARIFLSAGAMQN